jgi:hypothetical protein
MSKPVVRKRSRHVCPSTSLDTEFDRLIPDELRHLSSMHWTPVRVAARAATLLCTTPQTRVLDIGSGIGKLCTIGALSAAGTWVGVEQHAPLVKSAMDLARDLGVTERTRFLQADAFSIDWNEYDALYFYNPFELPLFDSGPSPSREVQSARVQQRLESLPSCTRVVTFHGFGGVMPPSFELLYHERMPSFGLDLALWIQRSNRHVVSVPS